MANRTNLKPCTSCTSSRSNLTVHSGSWVRAEQVQRLVLVKGRLIVSLYIYFCDLQLTKLYFDLIYHPPILCNLFPFLLQVNVVTCNFCILAKMIKISKLCCSIRNLNESAHILTLSSNSFSFRPKHSVVFWLYFVECELPYFPEPCMHHSLVFKSQEKLRIVQSWAQLLRDGMDLGSWPESMSQQRGWWEDTVLKKSSKHRSQ